MQDKDECRNILKCEKGFSLVEVVVAMSVMAVVLLGLAYAYNLTIQINIKNSYRNLSNEVGQNVMNRLRSDDFDNIEDMPSSLPALSRSVANLESYCNPDDSTHTGLAETRRFRSYNLDYEVVYKAFDTESGYGAELTSAKTIVMTVCWNFKGNTYYTNLKSVIQEDGL